LHDYDDAIQCIVTVGENDLCLAIPVQLHSFLEANAYTYVGYSLPDVQSHDGS